MKNFKIALAAVAVFGAIASLAFVKPKQTLVDYFYKAGFANQRLQSGINGGTLIERSINAPATVFFNTGSWQTGSVTFTPTADMSKYIGKITFSEEATADGSSDGDLTLSEALSLVNTAYVANSNVMPSSIPVGSGKTITVVAKTLATP